VQGGADWLVTVRSRSRLAVDGRRDSVSMMSGSRVLNWNGKDLPAELRELPAGRYFVEAVDDVPELTADEDDGIRQALASLRAGKGRSVEQVRQRIEAVLRK
jgi:hypothetical protein